MMGRNVALEALGRLCNASLTSFQKQSPGAGSFRADTYGGAGQQWELLLDIQHFIHTILDGEETSPETNLSFNNLKTVLQHDGSGAGFSQLNRCSIVVEKPTGLNFFDRRFDFDFTLKDTEIYYRGGEIYERPSGCYRSGLKVLDKYGENKWLGNRYRSTQSVPDEWPVSYHGTSKTGAQGIIKEYYKPGLRQAYGRGIYSTPYISEAIHYAKTFTSQKTGKSYYVILQNRINPMYREKHKNEKYWLIPIPDFTTGTEEQEMVQRAIRPYGLLLKEV